MARKPSERTSRHREPDELNLTPIMDMITTIMFFLLVFANIIPVVIIDAPLPKIADTASEVRMAKDREKQETITVSVTPGGFAVSSSVGGSKSFALVDGKHPYDEFHKYLVGLKPKMEKTREITLVPSDEVAYEVIILTMDASRELTKEDVGFQTVPPDIATSPEALRFNRLFPEVNLGGV